MERRIIFSHKALRQYLSELIYLETEWSQKIADEFEIEVDLKIQLIQKNPQMFIRTKRKSVYKCVVNKYVSIYYRVKKEEIEILLFHGNQQNPQRHQY